MTAIESPTIERLRVALDALIRQARKTESARNAAKKSQAERDANEKALRAIGEQIQEVVDQLREQGEEVTL